MDLLHPVLLRVWNIQVHEYICTVADFLEHKVNKIMLNNKDFKKEKINNFA